jgi:hypothetical protein
MVNSTCTMPEDRIAFLPGLDDLLKAAEDCRILWTATGGRRGSFEEG